MYKVVSEFGFESDYSFFYPVSLNRKNCEVLCIMVVSFVILAYPAVVQGANTTLPLTHLGRGPIRMENNWHFKHKSYFMEQNMRKKLGSVDKLSGLKIMCAC